MTLLLLPYGVTVSGVYIICKSHSVLEVEVVRVGELLRDAGVGGGCGVVEVPADVDGEHEREEVGVAVPDGRVQGGVAVLVLHGHLGWMGWVGPSPSVVTTNLGHYGFSFLYRLTHQVGNYRLG